MLAYACGLFQAGFSLGRFASVFVIFRCDYQYHIGVRVFSIFIYLWDSLSLQFSLFYIFDPVDLFVFLDVFLFFSVFFSVLSLVIAGVMSLYSSGSMYFYCVMTLVCDFVSSMFSRAEFCGAFHDVQKALFDFFVRDWQKVFNVITDWGAEFSGDVGWHEYFIFIFWRSVGTVSVTRNELICLSFFFLWSLKTLTSVSSYFEFVVLFPGNNELFPCLVSKSKMINKKMIELSFYIYVLDVLSQIRL